MSTPNDTTSPDPDETYRRPTRAGDHGNRPTARPSRVNLTKTADKAGGYEAPTVVDGTVVVDEDQAANVDTTTTPARTVGVVARRQTVQVISTVKAVATHDRTKAVARGSARHVWFPIAGAGVVTKGGATPTAPTATSG